MEKVLIKVSDPAASEARKLIEKLDCYLSYLYPAESNHFLSIESLQHKKYHDNCLLARFTWVHTLGSDRYNLFIKATRFFQKSMELLFRV